VGTFISVFTYLSDRVIHFCRNTGIPAMVSQHRDTIDGIPVFLHDVLPVPSKCCGVAVLPFNSRLEGVLSSKLRMNLLASTKEERRK
jgi:hypothetical protein